MSEKLHSIYGAERRIRVLSEHIAHLLPRNASVLDVGCGSGEIDSRILKHRTDATIRGIDVLVRPDTKIPVSEYDGCQIPFPDDSFNGVIFIDVLHHCDDAVGLLREARRVARHFVIIKDHRLNGFLAGPTLSFMDDVGNERFGVRLPYNYWPHERWHGTFRELRLGIVSWEQDLGLYPPGVNAIFGRGLHFLARLEVLPDESAPNPDE